MSSSPSSFLAPDVLRQLMLDAFKDLPEDVSHRGRPKPGHVYLSVTHAKALRPNSMIVEGMRGGRKKLLVGSLARSVHAHHGRKTVVRRR